jgi:methylphosphotriester-DNA--protein-cysteine methyltransferase
LKLKIYEKLDCKSGEKMKKDNRVFFKSKHKALINGYRPCGNCIHKTYAVWNKNK